MSFQGIANPVPYVALVKIVTFRSFDATLTVRLTKYTVMHNVDISEKQWCKEIISPFALFPAEVNLMFYEKEGTGMLCDKCFPSDSEHAFGGGSG